MLMIGERSSEVVVSLMWAVSIKLLPNMDKSTMKVRSSCHVRKNEGWWATEIWLPRTGQRGVGGGVTSRVVFHWAVWRW